MIKHNNQKGLGEEKVYFGLQLSSCILLLREVWARTEAEAMGSATSWLAQPALLHSLPKTTSPEVELNAYGELGYPTSINQKKKKMHRLAHRPIWWGPVYN